jgi:mono/diheme cytochrome c family protein
MQKLTTGARVALALIAGASLSAESARAQQQDTKPAAEESGLQDVERFEGGNAEAGEDLYLQYCRGCHGEDGRGAAHTFMPHVGNLAKKDYIEFLPDGYLFTVSAEGGAAVGKSGYMPAWEAKLSEQDIKDIIAHIRTLPTY